MKLPSIACCIFVTTCVVSGTIADDGRLAEQKRLLVTGSEGYRANRESFQHIVCRFRVTDAAADSEEQALAGNTRLASSHEVSWIVNENNVRYEEKCDESLYKNQLAKGIERKDSEIGAPCLPSTRLSDGSINLIYSPVMNTGNIRDPSNPGRGIDVTPFNIGGCFGDDEKYNPSQMINSVLKGELNCLGHRQEAIGGDELISVTLGKSPSQRHYDYTFVANQGFLLKQITIYSDSIVHGYTTDVKKCTKGRWFPMRSILIVIPPGKEAPVFVKEVKVLDLDVDNPPRKNVFALEMPKGSKLVNPSDMRSVIDFADTKRVKLEDLPSLLKKCQLALVQRKKGVPHGQITTNISEPRDNRRSRGRRNLWLAVTSIGCLCALAGIAWKRKRRQSSTMPIDPPM